MSAYSSDKAIIEALTDQVVFALTSGRYQLGNDDAQHLAEVIEPIIREREAKAWYEGEDAGLGNYEQDDLGDFISNPYRIEAKP